MFPNRHDSPGLILEIYYIFRSENRLIWKQVFVRTLKFNARNDYHTFHVQYNNIYYIHYLHLYLEIPASRSTFYAKINQSRIIFVVAEHMLKYFIIIWYCVLHVNYYYIMTIIERFRHQWETSERFSGTIDVLDSIRRTKYRRTCVWTTMRTRHVRTKCL